MTLCSRVVIVFLISCFFLINNGLRLSFERSECFVDVLAMADYELYQKWYGWSSAPEAQKSDDAKQNMKRYFSIVFNEVRHQYHTLKSRRFIVTIHLNDIIIADSPTTSFATLTSNRKRGNRVLAQDVMMDLRNFNGNNSNKLPKHDHLMLFTGYSLLTNEQTNPDEMTKGVAFSNAMCLGASSVSLIQDSGGFNSIKTVIHELGHSLGALHDGSNACTEEDQYIMAAVHGIQNESNKYNFWLFSPCTALEIDSHIAMIFMVSLLMQRDSCFSFSEKISQNVVNVTGQKPGQWFSPDEICQHIFGDESFLCRRTSEDNDEADVCLFMFCRDPQSNMCFRHVAPEGTSCGNRKWCKSGRCVFSKDAPVKEDGCIFGNRPFFRVNNLTCNQVVNKYPQVCRMEENVRIQCCESCYHKCEFGDILMNCDPRSCHQIFPNGTVYDRQCCKTCNKTFRCSDTPAINCSSLESYHCYNATTAFHCCSTCSSFRKVKVAGCEYGDRVSESECKTETLNGNLCSQQDLSNKCCDFCTQYHTSCSSVLPCSIFLMFGITMLWSGWLCAEHKRCRWSILNI